MKPARTNATNTATRGSKYYFVSFYAVASRFMILSFKISIFKDSNSKLKRSTVMQSKRNNSKNTAPSQMERSRSKCTFSGCSRSYSTKKNLNQHIKRSHVGEKFKCKQCDKVLETKYSVQRHVLASHKKECNEDDIQKAQCSPVSPIPAEEQDILLETQQQEIESLQTAIKGTREQIMVLRRRMIAKRRLSTDMKARSEKSLILLRKKY